jgi:Bacterial TniB protein
MTSAQLTHQQTLEKLQCFGPGDLKLHVHRHFSVRNSRIDHPAFCAAIREVAAIHSRGISSGIAEGKLILAQTGSGKSTALKTYKGHFADYVQDGIKKMPVVYVVTPNAPTVRSLAERILMALGDPAALRGTAVSMTDRIEYFFKQCAVELLMIDEFQHFNDAAAGKTHARVTDWLKNLLEATGVPVVLAGLPRSQLVINANSQLRRRFSSAFYLRPFSMDNDDEARGFRAVLKQIHEWIPTESIDLSEPNNARRFYYASHGLIDYVVKIVDQAVSDPLRGCSQYLSLEAYAEAFRLSVWRDAPDRLNPFCKNATLRPLTQPNEPFDIWDDPDKYCATSVRNSSGTSAAT